MLLALFFGLLGVHNFYIGRTGTGVLQLLLSLTCVGTIVVAIWSLIELFVVLEDAEGRRLG